MYMSTHSLKSTPNNRFFLRNLSWQFNSVIRIFAKNLLSGSCRRNIFLYLNFFFFFVDLCFKSWPHILFTFIEILRRQRHSPSRPFTRQLTLRYKRQDSTGNGNSEKIQSVLCEEALHVKRIFVVWRSLL